MSRRIIIFAVAGILLFAAALSGCAPASISNNAYTLGLRTLNIVDDYLDSRITRIEASDGIAYAQAEIKSEVEADKTSKNSLVIKINTYLISQDISNVLLKVNAMDDINSAMTQQHVELLLARNELAKHLKAAER